MDNRINIDQIRDDQLDQRVSEILDEKILTAAPPSGFEIDENGDLMPTETE